MSGLGLVWYLLFFCYCRGLGVMGRVGVEGESDSG